MAKSYYYGNYAHTKIWRAYLDAGWMSISFMEFARAMCPTAIVTGSVAAGATFTFKDDHEYTLFMLKWV